MIYITLTDIMEYCFWLFVEYFTLTMGVCFLFLVEVGLK